MADINSLIAEGAQFNMPNQLGQFAKLQQIQQGMQQQQLSAQQMQTGALQQKAAEFQLQKLQEDHANMVGLQQKLSQQGLTPRQFFEALQGSKDPQRQQAGIEGLMKLGETEKYDAYLKSKQTIPAQQPAMPVSGGLGTGTFGLDQTPGTIAPAMKQANALAPQAAPAAADPVAAIDSQIAELKNFIDPRAKEEVARLQKQRDELVKPHVVGRNLVTGAGTKIFEAPQDVTPTNLSRLMAERNALPPNDPQRKLYDAAISKETANTAAAQLQFEKMKFAWEKDNPSFQLEKVDQPDGSVQFVGVNKRTMVATPIMTAPPAGAMPPAAPAGAGRGSVGVTDITARIPLVGAAKNAQTTEGERKAATLLQRLQFSQGQLMQALKEKPDADKPGLFASAVGKLSTTGENLLNSAERQRVQAAQLDILDAALTLGTGAAYTKEQLEGYRTSYFPAYGDEPATVLDKQLRLKNVIDAAKTAAGRAAKLVPAAPAAAGGGSAREAADKILGL
jgi:hypothetical protein